MSLELRDFGRTGLRIPPIVFGATTLGNLFREIPDSQKAAIVEAWLNCGLKPIVVDSAGKYGAGLSLEVIGRELNRLQAPEDTVIISNKLGWRRVPLSGLEPTFEPGAWFGLKYDAVQDISREGILRCLHEGNQLLAGRTAQLVSVHDPDEYLAAAKTTDERQTRLDDLIQAYQALRELKDRGEVAAVGVGAKDWQVIRELADYCEFDWVMFANSLTVMRHPPELLAFIDSLAARQTAVINSALFQGGFLIGGDFFDYRRVDPGNLDDRQRIHWRERFWAVCREFDVSPFQAGVAFGRLHPGVTAVALSSSRPERIADHIQSVGRKVPGQLWTKLKSQGLIRDDFPYA